MEDVMTHSMESKLRLPSTYVEVGDNEMEYLDGAGFWKIFGFVALGIGIACAVVATGGAVAAALGVVAGTKVAAAVLVGFIVNDCVGAVIFSASQGVVHKPSY